MRELDYPVLIEPLAAEDGGGFLATVPDLPGCMSDGETPEEALAHVRDAIASWIEEARAIGHSRGGHPEAADADIAEIDACLAKLRAAHNDYWATQTEVLADSARAWQAKAKGDNDGATQRLAAAADREDAIEKRPVTPGPIVPAREQLADMLLELGRPADALREYRSALTLAPGRRGSVSGAATAAARVGDTKTVAAMRALLADRQ